LSEISEVTLPHEISLATSVYHLYVIQIENRNGLQKFLGEKGIGTGLHYPIPLHMQKAYKHLGYKEGDFPVAEKTAKNILSLPMFPELSKGQIEYVADCIKQWLNR
jgi:dTDP-4-amino-4,6-dideoxygalactose transaminase